MALFSRRLGVERLDSRRMFAALISESLPMQVHEDRHDLPVAAMSAQFASDVATNDRLPREELIDQIAVSVAAENLVGVRAAELRFEYPIDKLDIDPASMKLGEAWRGKASMIKKVDEDAGSISVFIFSAQPLGAPEGEMFEFEASVIADTTTSVAPQDLMELVKFELNEGQMTTLPTVSLQMTSHSGETLEATHSHRLPESVPGFIGAFPASYAQAEQTFDSMVESVDREPGEQPTLVSAKVHRLGSVPAIYVSSWTTARHIASSGSYSHESLENMARNSWSVESMSKRATPSMHVGDVANWPTSGVEQVDRLATTVQSDSVGPQLVTVVNACAAWW